MREPKYLTLTRKNINQIDPGESIILIMKQKACDIRECPSKKNILVQEEKAGVSQNSALK